MQGLSVRLRPWTIKEGARGNMPAQRPRAKESEPPLSHAQWLRARQTAAQSLTKWLLGLHPTDARGSC